MKKCLLFLSMIAALSVKSQSFYVGETEEYIYETIDAAVAANYATVKTNDGGHYLKVQRQGKTGYVHRYFFKPGKNQICWKYTIEPTSDMGEVIMTQSLSEKFYVKNDSTWKTRYKQFPILVKLTYVPMYKKNLFYFTVDKPNK